MREDVEQRVNIMAVRHTTSIVIASNPSSMKAIQSKSKYAEI